MRIAVLSDIHGNLIALNAVLADMHGRYDRIVCLGDVAAKGPQPREAIQAVREFECPVVMGNTDVWILEPEPITTTDPDERRIRETELWSSQQLTDDDRAFLRTFKPTVVVDVGGKPLLGYHGSPRSNTEDILPTTPDEKLDEMFRGWQADLMAGGHTHEQMLRRYGGGTIINPGSIGDPRAKADNSESKRVPNSAEYAIVCVEAGRLSIDLRRVPFDARALAQAIRASGMPHAGYWASQWET
jgi:predicted phosphodiesterase